MFDSFLFYQLQDPKSSGRFPKCLGLEWTHHPLSNL